jgi:methionine-rich copper-binding protein CopC
MVAVIALFGLSTPASAHAQLAIANPKVSSVLTKAPVRITLTFDDDLIAVDGGNQIAVTDPKGKPVSQGASQLNGATLSVALKKLTVFGRYKVLYRVLSADGHPVSAFYYFYFQKKK